MKLVFASSGNWFPAISGAEKANVSLVRQLVARGHECRVVVPAASAAAPRQLLDLDVLSVPTRGELRGALRDAIAHARPDCVVVSDDDASQSLFSSAASSGYPAVLLVHALTSTPFGPWSYFPSESRKALYPSFARVVTFSKYAVEYLRRWGAVDAVHFRLPVFGRGPFPEFGRFDNPFVTFVNPSQFKGLSIFQAVVRALPHARFAAVPTWATTSGDRAVLAGLGNVTVLDAEPDFERILERTRVLLMPSLGPEVCPLTPVEAMLRGIPVVTSDVGGLPEAKLGTNFVIPVRPITRFGAATGENLLPIAEVPPQDVTPWVDAISRLTTNAELYARESAAASETARRYVADLSIKPLEEVIATACQWKGPVARSEVSVRVASPVAAPVTTMSLKDIGALVRAKGSSPEVRTSRPSNRNRPAAWFPFRKHGGRARFRLFCIPGAAAGASVWNDWASHFDEQVELCAMELPGRGARFAEAPIATWSELVPALAEAIAPLLDTPFAVLGCSLGGKMAYELLRHLARGKAESRGLIVAGTAPFQKSDELRRLSDEALIERILQFVDARRVAIHGDRASVARAYLPVVRADMTLVGTWSPPPTVELTCPILALGGDADPECLAADLEGWRSKTTGTFAAQSFTGGHEFVFDAAKEVSSAVGAFLSDVEKAIS